MRRRPLVFPGTVSMTSILAVVLVATAAVCQAADEPFEVQRDVEYAQLSGERLIADVYVPRGEGPFPGVLVVHGGAFMMAKKKQSRPIASYLAEHGYTAVAIDLRMAPQFLFPAQIEDCKAAVRWMRTHAAEYKIDPARIGGFGYAAGAHLVTLLGTTDPSAGLEGPNVPADSPSTRLQCVVAGSTPCDFRNVPADGNQLSFWLGGTRAEKPDIYVLASPANFISKDDPPMFFYHGENDRLVPIESPQAMVAELKKAGVPAELYTVPKAGLMQAFLDPQALDAAVKFLDRHLKQQPAAAEK